jgi:cell division protein FtsQ
MWDRPDMLNNISNVLVAVSVLLVLSGSIFVFANLPWFQVRRIDVSNALEPAGQLRHVTREEVREIAAQRLDGTFFTVNPEAARSAFARLPWVRNAEVRRVWPDRLDVAVEEHEAFANWGSDKLVNTHGELFDAARIDGLPEFSGPEGSETEVTRHYRDFSAPLGKLDLKVREIALSPRLAWELKLDNGLALKLGRDLPRDPLEIRIERFVAAYPDAVAKAGGRINVADLRYAQGFATRLPGAAAGASNAKPAPAKAKDSKSGGNARAPVVARGGA